MACKLAALGVLLLIPANGIAQAPSGRSASSFVPRDGLPVPEQKAPTRTVPIVPVQATDPAKPGDLTIQNEPYVRLESPGKEKLFGTRETEKEVEERMRQEAKDANRVETIQFPEKLTLTKESYQPRQAAPLVVLAEPSYVVYRRLYFEEKNSERYGWDLGMLQPAISSLNFFKDVALAPHNFWSNMHCRFETNAGQCRPGDPVPLYLYPPEITITGSVAEAGVVTGLFLIAP